MIDEFWLMKSKIIEISRTKSILSFDLGFNKNFLSGEIQNNWNQMERKYPLTVKQASSIARSLLDQLAHSVEKGNGVLFWKSKGEVVQFGIQSPNFSRKIIAQNFFLSLGIFWLFTETGGIALHGYFGKPTRTLSRFPNLPIFWKLPKAANASYHS